MKCAPLVLARLFGSDCRVKFLSDSEKLPPFIRLSLTCYTTIGHLWLIFSPDTSSSPGPILHPIFHLIFPSVRLVGWLCLTSYRQRGHLETAPPLLSLAKDVKLELHKGTGGPFHKNLKSYRNRKHISGAKMRFTKTNLMITSVFWM